MKVEYIQGKAGYKFNINVGDVEDVSEEKGKRLIKIGHAVLAKKDATANVVIPTEVREMSQKATRAKREKEAKKKKKK